ncbi:MAG: T9SS type A sorting domain-containing protein [Bacteroidia bacterium]
MRLDLVTFFLLLLAVEHTSIAQTVPPAAIGSQLAQNPMSGNTTVRKLQTIYAPGHFLNNQTNGRITHLYFRALGSITSGLQVDQLEIKLKQVTFSSFANNQFVDSLTTVVFPVPNRVFSAADIIGPYLRIQLDQPFTYDRTQSLVVEVSSNSALGTFTGSGVTRAASRIFAISATASSGSLDNVQWNMGFDLLNLQPNNARLDQIIAPATNRIHVGNNAVAVAFTNMSPDTLLQLQLGYRWGTQQVHESWSGFLVPGASAVYTFSDSLLASPSQTDTLISWCALPNGQIDSNANDDTLSKVLNTTISAGVYTVGQSGANFNTIQQALDAFNDAGIAGSVILELQPGTYLESLSFGSQMGTDSLRRVHLRPSSNQANSVTIVGHQAPALFASGTNWVSVTKINFERNGVQSGQSGVVVLQNSTQWQFDSCQFIVANNNYQSQPNLQSNFRANQVQHLTITNSHFQEGIYQLEITHTASAANHNLLVANCRFHGAKGGIYQLNGVNGFNFHQNTVVKNDVSISGAYTQFLHNNGLNVAFTRNLIEVTARGSLFVLENLNRSSSTVNLFANNVISFDLLGNASFIYGNASTPGFLSYDFVYNSVRLQTAQIPLFNSGMFHFMSSLPSRYNGITIQGNILQWIDGGNPSPFYRLGSSQIAPLLSINENLYNLSHPHRYASLASGQFVAFQQVASWDMQSWNKPFELDSTQQYRLIGPDNSRLGTLRTDAQEDFLGNARTGPSTDLGAFELPFFQRPILVFNPPGNVDSLGPRPVLLRTITQQAGDSVPILLRFKYATDSAWVNSTVHRTSANEYTAIFDYSLLNGTPYGPREIEYYFAYQDNAGQWQSFPFGGNQLHAPSRRYSYQILPVLAGTYEVGLGRDFPDLQSALAILSNTRIAGHVTLLLTDTSYSHAYIGNITEGLALDDSSYTITLQPALGVHTKIQLLGPNAGFAIRNLRNFAFLGQDSLGGGSVELVYSGSQSFNFIQLTATGGACHNIRLSYLKFNSTLPLNNSIGIHAAAQGANRHREIEITHNQFFNQINAMQLSRLANSTIAHNVIGNATETSRSTIFGLSAEHSDTLLVHHNRVENVSLSWYSNSSASGFRFFNMGQGLEVSNNIIQNFGSDSLWTVFGTLTTQISGMRFEGNIPGATVTGNLIRGIRGPKARSSSLDPWFEIAGVYDLANLTQNSAQLTYAHNSIFIDGLYTSNTRLRTAPIVFTTNYNRRFYNNLLANNAKGDTSRFLAGIYYMPTHALSALLNMELSHNSYLLDTANQVNLYQSGNGLSYADLESWRSQLAQPGRQQETTAFLRRVDFSIAIPQPDAPLIALGQLLKSNALQINLPPNASNDLNGVPRGNATQLADIGAYQISSPSSVDAEAPILSLLSLDTNAILAYPGGVRSFSVQATDAESGVSEVYLSLWNGETESRVLLTRSSGTAHHATWTGSLPADTLLPAFSLSVAARDTVGNTVYSGISKDYTNLDGRINIKTRAVVSTRNTIEAEALSPARQTLRFTELSFSRNAPGRTPTFPAYVDSSQHRFLEISNLGTDSVNLNGYYLSANQIDTFRFNANIWMAPGSILLFSSGSGQADIPNLYFRWFMLDIIANTSSNQQYLLYGPEDELIDELVINGRTTNFIPAHNAWKGDFLRPISGTSGLKLVGMDMNSAKNWEINSPQSPGSLGLLNSGIPQQQAPQFQWGGIMNGQTAPKAQLGPLPGGRYPIALQSTLYGQHYTDTVLINVSGSDSTDFIPPLISEVQYSNDFFDARCNTAIRTLTVRVQDTGDGSGVSAVWVVMEQMNGLLQTQLMRRISGNIADGRYEADMSGLRNPAMLKIVAKDNNELFSDTLELGNFENTRYGLLTSGDTTINAGSQVKIGAKALRPDRLALQLTEVVFFPTGSGSQPVATYPAGLNISGTNDAFEITNMGNSTLFVGGLKLVVFSTGATNPTINYTLPDYFLPPAGQMFLVISELAQNAPNVFKISNQTSLLTSGIAYGIYLFDPSDSLYLSALSTNGYNFPATLNIPAHVWSGPAIADVQGRSSVFRINANNNATGWAPSINASTLMNLGSFISWPIPTDTVQWYSSTGFIGSGDSILVSPTQNSLYIAEVSNGSCTARDTIFVAVNSSSNSFDIEVLDILDPVHGQPNLSSVSVRARVINRSNVAINQVPMQLLIQSQVFASESLRAFMAPGDTSILQFNTLWQPPLGELHRVCVVSAFPGDQNLLNDSACVITFGRPLQNKARVLEVISPANGAIVQDSVLVRVRVRNVGTDTLSQLHLVYGQPELILHQQTFNVFLLPGQEQVVTFSRQYSPVDTINTLCMWSISHPNERRCVTVGRATNVPGSSRVGAGVTLYPNPAQERVFIQLEAPVEVYTILLRDVQGRIVAKVHPDFEHNRMALNTQMLPNGLYFVQLSTSSGTSVKKLLIRR